MADPVVPQSSFLAKVTRSPVTPLEGVNPDISLSGGIFPGIDREFPANGAKVRSTISRDARGQYRQLYCDFDEERLPGKKLFYDMRIWTDKKTGERELVVMWPRGKEGNWQSFTYDVHPDYKLTLRKIHITDPDDIIRFMKEKTGREVYEPDSYFSGIEFDEQGDNPVLARRRRGSIQELIPEKTVPVEYKEIENFMIKYDMLEHINAELHKRGLPPVIDAEQRLNPLYFELSHEQTKEAGRRGISFAEANGPLPR